MTEERASVDDEADETVLRINDVTQADWNYWHSHPASRLLRKYLRDFSETLELALLQRWRAKELDLSTEHEVRNRIIQLGEIEKLTFENVADFYETPREETTRA